jgi:choline-sulfatase
MVKTPNMDRLAAMGTLFTNSYCGAPICCASRASMMTGRYASDVAVYCNATAFEGGTPTWGNLLTNSGYYCWATGKLDLCPGRDLGFHEVQTEHGNYEEPDISSLLRRPCCFRPGVRNEVGGGVREKPLKEQPRVDRALGFLRNDAPKQERPWVMYLGMEAPKSFRNGGLPQYLALYPEDKVPMPVIPAGHLERMHLGFQRFRDFGLCSVPFPEKLVRRARASYYANISETDALVGLILDQLETTGRLQDTVIVYTADHGELAGEHGMWTKGCLLEAAARVPMIIAGPGLPRGRKIDTPVSHVDMTATLLELAVASAPADLRGRSLLGLVNGRPGGPEFAFSETHCNGNCTGSFMIRRGEWKYVYFSWFDGVLFNIKDDPNELHDLAGDTKLKPLVREMHSLLTTVVDPDLVTQQAFEEQERRFEKIVRSHNAKEFFDMFESRLGKGQTMALVNRYYRTRI